VPRTEAVVETGGKQVEEFVKVQRVLLNSFQEMHAYWWNRVQSESQAGAQLFAELATSKSFPEALAVGQVWSNRLLQRMADDSRHFVADTQKCMETEMRLVSNGWDSTIEKAAN